MPVGPDDLSLRTGLARCRGCNNVFRFDTAPELAASDYARPLAGKPRNVTIREGRAGLVIRHRWFTPPVLVYLLFCGVWNALVVGTMYHDSLRDEVLFTLLPGIVFIGIGVWLAYMALALCLNTTTLTLDRACLRVRHHPVPWPGNLDLPMASVRQLVCEKRVRHGRRRTSHSYVLEALLKDGRRTRVLSSFKLPDVPLYMQQHAEAWMKAAARPEAEEPAR